MILGAAAGVMILAWCIATCTRNVLETVEFPSHPWPAWLERFAYIVGTRSVFNWGLALLALVPFEGLLLFRFNVTEKALLLWVSWLYFGLVLISPRKTPVVFLRRFGLTRNNDIVRKAFSRYLRGFRLLTLDDQKFAAAPFPIRGAGAPLGTAALVAVSFIIAAQASCNEAVLADMQRAEFVGWLMRSIYEALKGAFMFAVMLAGAVAVCGLIVASALVWWSRRTITIRKASELFRLSWLAHRLRSRAWAPSLGNPAIVVINVAHEQWQSAIQTLLGTGATVLIDVSRPGEGLLWEVRELVKSNVPFTLIAESHDFQRWQLARQDQHAQQLADAIRDRTVLEYDASSGNSPRDLARTLRPNLPSARLSRLSIRFAALASLMGFLYLLITIAVMPWPQPAAAWINRMSLHYLGILLVF